MPKHKTNLWTLLAVAAVAVLVVQFSGIYDFSKLIQQPAAPQQVTPIIPQQTVTTHSANAKWQISNALDKVATASGDTAYVCVVRADSSGYFDLLEPVEETELDASPDTSAGIYVTGDELLIAVSSDNDPTTGDETYPRWFAIQHLDNGAHIKAMPIDDPISGLTEYTVSGKVKYKVNYGACEDTAQTVTWLEGATPYWVFGDYFYVYGRLDNANVVQSITNKGVTLTSVSDGSTWDDTSGEVNSNVTLAADTEDFYFEITGKYSDMTWGLPCLVVKSTGAVKQYSAVLVFATSGTAISQASMMDDGWIPFTIIGCTNNVTFYYPVDPVSDGLVPSTGDVPACRIPISITDTGLSTSTEYNYAGWMMDWQSLEDVDRGAFATALPTVYGFLSEYGSDTVIQSRAPTVSSGTLSTPQLYGYFTTNS